METRNFGIREKIIASFLILIVIFGINGIYNLVTINNSQNLLWGIMNEKDPSLKSLNQFSDNIYELIIESSSNTHSNAKQQNNNNLVEIKLIESKKQLLSNSLFWESNEEKVLLKTVMEDLDSLTKSVLAIKTIKMENSPNGDSIAVKIYNEKVIPLSTKILENSNVLMQAKEVEKENYKLNLINSFSTLKNGIFTLGVLIIVICIVISIYTSYTVLNQVKEISKNMDDLGLGVFPELIKNPGNDEIGSMAKAMNTLINGLKDTTNFAKAIGAGAFDTTFTPLSNDDVLGTSLINMRDDIKNVNEEDKLRNWINEGYAQFSSLLSHNYTSRIELADSIIIAFVKYLKANQGTFFVVNQIGDDEVLEAIATYAWDRKKYTETQYLKGEGLAGQAWVEGQYILLTEVPENYARIKSGIGEACPRCVIVVPLKYNDKIYGIIELATFNVFSETEKNLILKISETIAATLSNTMISHKIKALLEDSQSKENMLREKEEEMRKSLEELETNQEEMRRNEKEKDQYLTTLLKENEMLKEALNQKG